MSDVDKDSKTEDASGKRVQEEFAKGNFAQSQEVGVAITLAAALGVVAVYGSGIVNSVFEITTSIFSNLGSFDINENNIEHWSAQSFTALTKMAGPFLVGGMAAGILSGGLQSKFRLTPKALKFGVDKLNPVTGAKRLFGKDVLVRFGIDLLKMAAISWVMYGAVKKITSDPIFFASIDFKHIGIFIVDTMIFVLWRLIIALAIIAAISYIYQSKKKKDDLKMTKEEVKQERKDQEMSPEVRKARMQMAARLMQTQMLDEVPNADVVVTNPTHYAVAMKYERGVDNAPMVLAKGENAFAKRIKEVAQANGVPIVENKIVARMMYKFGRVGDAIPMEMYQSVAEILAFVYKAHSYYFHKLKARRQAKRR
ncbi:EscU/YscU/HrcU family type III secretion system export apparatus switch protein [Puniceicoccaceae bacterium K14]|nr:EscU/YscU/HrcU family type III secretion system export apparatus switch protein [Puniceicoccaceae bacterium K14]